MQTNLVWHMSSDLMKPLSLSHLCKPFRSRFDTSRKHWRRLPPCPPGYCLGALEVLKIEIYNFLRGCPLARAKCPGAFALSTMKHTRLKGHIWSLIYSVNCLLIFIVTVLKRYRPKQRKKSSTGSAQRRQPRNTRSVRRQPRSAVSLRISSAPVDC